MGSPVTPADLDVDRIYEASRTLDRARDQLGASHELATRLAGGAQLLDRLVAGAALLTEIEQTLPALRAELEAITQAREQLHRARAELAVEAWPPSPDARPILERLQAAVPQLDRLAEVMALLEQAEVIGWRR